MIKKIIVITFLVFGFLIAQQSIGGTPYSIEHRLLDVSNKITLPVLNIDQLLEEDRNAPLATPFRYGYKFDVNLSLHNSGEWLDLDNGDRIWKLSIYSKDAYAICLEYDQFYLPDGASLFIYNENNSMVLGAYTKDNNQDDMLFAANIYGQYSSVLAQGNWYKIATNKFSIIEKSL